MPWTSKKNSVNNNIKAIHLISIKNNLVFIILVGMRGSCFLLSVVREFIYLANTAMNSYPTPHSSHPKKYHR